MLSGEFFCILASVCWAFTPIISTASLRKVGPTNFTRLRFLIGIPILFALSLLFVTDWNVNLYQFFLLAMSGIIGILIGDLLLFNSLSILGPRRSYLLFSLNAPLAAVAGFFLFHEKMSMQIILGCALCLMGAAAANIFAKKSGGKTDQVDGNFNLGVIFAIGAAICQVGSLFLLKATMETSVDPMMATLIRVSVAAVLINLPPLIAGKAISNLSSFDLPDFRNVLLASFLGTGLGMIFLSYGVSATSTGLAAFLTSLSPIFILPIVTLYDQQSPPKMAWAGAITSAIGLYFIFI